MCMRILWLWDFGDPTVNEQDHGRTKVDVAVVIMTSNFILVTGKAMCVGTDLYHMIFHKIKVS